MSESFGPVRIEELRGGVPLHVVATTEEGTRGAIGAAQAAAEAADSRVYLLGSPEHALSGIPSTPMHGRVTVLSCVWRRVSDLALLMPPRAVVFIGGRCRRFWPTSEQRLARQFVRLGCRVVFVEATMA